VPPPGTYNPSVLPSGSRLWNGAEITVPKGEKRTYLDQEQKVFKNLPGPGAYDAHKQSTLVLKHGTKIVRDYVKNISDEGVDPGWCVANVRYTLIVNFVHTSISATPQVQLLTTLILFTVSKV
jgi:hypothetical protein